MIVDWRLCCNLWHSCNPLWSNWSVMSVHWGEGNLRPCRPPCEYLGEYTSRGKPKIPHADRILMDPGHKARKNSSNNAELGFRAVGPALCIMQLNVEGLSAAKCHIIQSLAEIHHIDVICLQEWRQVRLPHNLRFRHHQLHTPCQTWTCNICSQRRLWCCTCVVISMLQCHSRGRLSHCQRLQTTNWTLEQHKSATSFAVLVGDFNSHHPDWGYQEADLNGESLQEWALNSHYLLLHDAKPSGTFHSARWQRDYLPDLCWISTTVGRPKPASSVVLGDFPRSQHRPSVIHIGLQLPIIRGVQRRRWNFRKLYSRHRTFHSADSCQQHQRWGIIPVFLWCYAESSPPFHSTRFPPDVHSVFGWGVPRFTEAVRWVWWSRHSWPSHRVTRCSSPASLGRTDVEDELNALKLEVWCCSTTTQVNTSVSQRQCRCRSSHPGCYLKHCTTRSSNARFVCRVELFCSRCQTRVFAIHSLKRF